MFELILIVIFESLKQFDDYIMYIMTINFIVVTFSYNILDIHVILLSIMNAIWIKNL
jgi:hypothetical protein